MSLDGTFGRRLPQGNRPPMLSAEARAQLIVDAIGTVGEGDYRKRTFDVAVEQIRSAVAQSKGELP